MNPNDYKLTKEWIFLTIVCITIIAAIAGVLFGAILENIFGTWIFRIIIPIIMGMFVIKIIKGLVDAVM